MSATLTESRTDARVAKALRAYKLAVAKLNRFPLEALDDDRAPFVHQALRDVDAAREAWVAVSAERN